MAARKTRSEISAMNARGRTRDAGKFDFDDMSIVCVCGHTLGEHAHSKRNCIAYGDENSPGYGKACQGTNLDRQGHCKKFQKARAQPARSNPESEIGKHILESSARTVYVLSYADRVEDLGLDGPGWGGDWMDYAPAGFSVKAQRWAEEVWTEIVARNPLGMPAGTSLTEGIEECWRESAEKYVAKLNKNLDRRAEREWDFEDIFDDEKEQTDFGHYIVMQVLGTGSRWSDDHAEHGLKLPFRESDAWGIVPDADLAPLVSDDLLREEIEAYEEPPDEDYVEGEWADDPGNTYTFLDRYESAEPEDALEALSALTSHLNYAAAYHNEGLRRAHTIAEILEAAARRERDGKSIEDSPRENPIVEYKKTPGANGVYEVSTPGGHNVLNTHLRLTEQSGHGVYIEAEVARGSPKHIGGAWHYEYSVSLVVYISTTRLPWSASLEERAEHAKDDAFFVYRDQDDKILVPAGYERHDTGCPWGYEEGDYGVGKCTCSQETRDAIDTKDAFRALSTYLFPVKHALDVRTPTRLDGRLMELREVFGGRKITTTYEIYTPESIEAGDTEETGWVNEDGQSMEPDEYDIEEGKEKYGEGITVSRRGAFGVTEPAYVGLGLSDVSLGAVYLAVKFLRDEGASDQGFSNNDMYYGETTQNRAYFEQGIDERHTYHLVNFDEDELKAIHAAMRGPRRNPSTNPHPMDFEACSECGRGFIEKSGKLKWKRTDVIPFDLDPSICSDCGVTNQEHRKGVRDFEAAARAAEQREIDEVKAKLNPTARPTRPVPRASNPAAPKYDAGAYGTPIPKWRGAKSRGHIGVQKGIDWDSQPLGDVSDRELARRLGVSKSVVTAARTARRIPPAARGA